MAKTPVSGSVFGAKLLDALGYSEDEITRIRDVSISAGAKGYAAVTLTIFLTEDQQAAVFKFASDEQEVTVFGDTERRSVPTRDPNDPPGV